MITYRKIINKLKLIPHPEGGYYRETFRSKGMIRNEHLPDIYTGKRNYSTCIYYLLKSGSFSAFHRLTQDEIWHFYDGSPVNIHLISAQGSYSKVTVGRDLISGEVPQLVIPGGTWFAVGVGVNNSFSLVGCTVAPGFDFSDFELGDRAVLIEKYPQHHKILTQFTRKQNKKV